ncbi:ribokinase [soil metagenome]
MVGSANMDVVFRVERVPGPGETLLAESVHRYPGGKGLNQAVAAARAGVVTSFVGALGADGDGDQLRATMNAVGIATSQVRTELLETGQAFIVVDAAGENTIIVASGANGTVTELGEFDRAAVAASAVLLIQLELPLTAVHQAARAAREAEVLVVLNAAPAAPIDDELLELVDFLVVNEHEAELLGARFGAGLDPRATLAGIVPRLVVTLGSRGSVLFEHGAEIAQIAAPSVEAVDSTGAGDSFCGAFAAALAEGRDFRSAASFGTAAAALSVQRLGALPSIPFRAEIEAASAGWGLG